MPQPISQVDLLDMSPHGSHHTHMSNMEANILAVPWCLLAELALVCDSGCINALLCYCNKDCSFGQVRQDKTWVKHADKSWTDNKKEWHWTTDYWRAYRRVLWHCIIFRDHRHTSRLRYQQKAWACIQVFPIWPNIHFSSRSKTVLETLQRLRIQSVPGREVWLVKKHMEAQEPALLLTWIPPVLKCRNMALLALWQSFWWPCLLLPHQTAAHDRSFSRRHQVDEAPDCGIWGIQLALM